MRKLSELSHQMLGGQATVPWTVRQLECSVAFCCRTQSDPKFSSSLLRVVGGVDTNTRKISLKGIERHKSRMQESKANPKNVQRRKMARLIQLYRVGKNATKSAAHKTDKVSPKMDGKSSLATKPKPKRRCA